MIQTIELLPGVVLRCWRDTRFKQGCLSFQFLRRMDSAENHLNALLPSVLFRATENYPDIRSIGWHLDDLYNVSMGPLVRQVGDYQTVGFHARFLDDRFCLPGESVLPGVLDFLEEVLVRPLLGDGCFVPALVDSEKKNLVSFIESELNSKGAYAMGRLMNRMCKGDSYGLSRLGDKKDVAAIEPKQLYDHYNRVLRESPIEIFYVGSADPETIAEYFCTMLGSWQRDLQPLPAQTGFRGAEPGEYGEEMDVTQGKLCLGFTTPITCQDREFAAMQMLNCIFGAGMTSKLFLNVREKLSLCYSIFSEYHSSKGVFTVGAGIDFDKEQQTRQEIFRQLELCRQGQISEEELKSARETLCSSLRAVHDNPGAIENYYSSSVIHGVDRTPAQYMAQIQAVTVEDVIRAAQSITYHSGFFLKGVEK